VFLGAGGKGRTAYRRTDVQIAPYTELFLLLDSRYSSLNSICLRYCQTFSRHSSYGPIAPNPKNNFSPPHIPCHTFIFDI